MKVIIYYKCYKFAIAISKENYFYFNELLINNYYIQFIFDGHMKTFGWLNHTPPPQAIAYSYAHQYSDS